MSAYDPANWRGLFIGMAQASLGLTGLTFVMMTLRIFEVRHHRIATDKRVSAITPLTLVVAFIVAALVLIPGQSNATLGAEIAGVIVAGLVVMALLIFGDPDLSSGTAMMTRWALPRMAIGFIGSLLALAGAIGLTIRDLGGLWTMGIGYLLVFGAAVQGMFDGIFFTELAEAFVDEVREILAEKEITVVMIARRSDHGTRTSKLLEQIRSCTVLSCESLEAGVDLTCTNNPDVILCSASLLEGCVSEFVDELKAHGITRDIPVVVLDHRPTNKAKSSFMVSGAFGYLAEPVDRFRFHHVLGKALAPFEVARLQL